MYGETFYGRHTAQHQLKTIPSPLIYNVHVYIETQKKRGTSENGCMS